MDKKIVLLLRVKNGMFFLTEWLTCFEKLVDEIVVVDNDSNDGTYEVLKAHLKVVDITITKGFEEGRDKILVYEMARKRKPDWCLWLDVDEIFEESITRADLDALINQNKYTKISFRRFHFASKNKYAASLFWLMYSTNHDRFLWKESSDGYFQNSKIDNGNIQGIKGKTQRSSFRLKHLGYINKQIVDQKANLYRSIVPEKETTFQRMYLDGVKTRVWVSDRNSLAYKLNAIEMNLWLMVYFLKRVFQKLFAKW